MNKNDILLFRRIVVELVYSSTLLPHTATASTKTFGYAGVEPRQSTPVSQLPLASNITTTATAITFHPCRSSYCILLLPLLLLLRPLPQQLQLLPLLLPAVKSRASGLVQAPATAGATAATVAAAVAAPRHNRRSSRLGTQTTQPYCARYVMYNFPERGIRGKRGETKRHTSKPLIK